MKDIVSNLYSAFQDLLDMVGMHRPPRNLLWFVTEKCNLRCQHCFVWNSLRQPRSEMPLNDMITFLKLAEPCLHNITITGGEPMLCPHIDEFLYHISKMKKMQSIRICTNGHKSEELIGILRKTVFGKMVCSITTSLDGPEIIHNRIRGSATAYSEFLNLIKGIQRLHGVSLDIITTVSESNYRYLDETFDIAQQLNTKLTLNYVRSSKNAKTTNANDFAPAKHQALSVADMMRATEKWYAKIGIHSSSLSRRVNRIKMDNIAMFVEKGTWQYPCAAGISDAVLFSDGAVSICETQQPLGNIYDYELDWRKFWRNRKRKLNTCYCQWDCAITSSLTKSVQGYKTFLTAKKPLL